MTKEELKNEIIRCGRDPVYFIKKYVKIKHPTRGLIPFKMFGYQEKLVQDYQSNRFNVILKARQLGITEITASYATWLMLFHRHKNILVMATKAETAKNLIKRVATAMKHLPRWMMLAEISIDNRLSIELNNGSQIKAIASSDDAGRSEAVSLLIIDEAAFIHGFDELWTGLLPTVQAGGCAVVLSTPNGVGNKFYQIYTEAEKGENDFHPTKLMWWEHPERISDLQDDPDRPGFKTSSWFRKEISSANMNDRDIAQELETNFNASGETVLSANVMSYISEGLFEPIEKQWWDRNLYVWWRPEQGKKYIISADVGRGDGGDNSAAHVFEQDTMEQKAEYYGKIPTEEFAKLLCELGHTYFTAPLVVENNNVGLACLEHIRLMGYEAVYYSRKGDMRAGEIVNSKWGTTESDLVQGFTTSPKTRPLIIAKLEEYLRSHTQMVVRSKRMLNELKTFIWNNGRPEAMRGRNDDLVMSAAIAAWYKDTVIAPQGNERTASEKLIAGISMMNSDVTRIPGASKDPDHVRKQQYAGKLSRPDLYEMAVPVGAASTPGGSRMDLKWLLDCGISKG